MTTAKININEITSRLSYLQKMNIQGDNAEVCITERNESKSLRDGSDAYVANLLVDGDFCVQIGTLPRLVDASVFVQSIMKMKKW